MWYCTIVVALSQGGCCYANDVIMLNSMDQGFPPCMNRYMSQQCPDASYTDLCITGTNSNTTMISASVNLTFGYPNLPDMYNKSQVFTLEGILIALMILGGAQGNPLNTIITDYEYYYENGTVIPAFDANGNLNTDDYTAGVAGGVFNYNIYFGVSVTETEAQSYLATMMSQNYADFVGNAYSQPDKAFVTVNASSYQFNMAEPFDTAHSGAAAVLPSSGLAGIMTVLTFLLLVQWM